MHAWDTGREGLYGPGNKSSVQKLRRSSVTCTGRWLGPRICSSNGNPTPGDPRRVLPARTAPGVERPAPAAVRPRRRADAPPVRDSESPGHSPAARVTCCRSSRPSRYGIRSSLADLLHRGLPLAGLFQDLSEEVPRRTRATPAPGWPGGRNSTRASHSLTRSVFADECDASDRRASASTRPASAGVHDPV